MPRHNKRKAYRVRYKKPGKKFGTKFSFSDSILENRNRAQGRVLRVSKISKEEVERVAEFNKLPDTLMREFRGRERTIIS